MVEVYNSSGLSAPRFAALHGVNYHTLVSWIKKGRQVDCPDRFHPASLSLIPAEIDQSSVWTKGEPMEVLLPGGTRLMISGGSQVDLAGALIRQLSKQRPC